MKYIVNVLIPNTLMQKRIDERRKTWKPFNINNIDNTTSIGDEVFMEMVDNSSSKDIPKTKTISPKFDNGGTDDHYTPVKKSTDTGVDTSYDPTKLKRKTRKMIKNRDDNKLIIFNLPLCNEDDLKEFLTQYAPIKYINFVYDKNTGKFKNFAFIETYNKEDAEYILEECDGKAFNYLILKIKKVIPKK
jgi:RNA recognition motif-containing protein